MEGQQQAVDRRPPASVGDLLDNLVEDLVLDRPGRRGPGHHRRGKLVAELFGAGDEPADLVVGIPPDRHQVIAAAQAALLEPRPIGRQRREGVRLVHDPADGDAHGRRSCGEIKKTVRHRELDAPYMTEGTPISTPAIHLSLKATQQVVYCEGTLLVAYSW